MFARAEATDVSDVAVSDMNPPPDCEGARSAAGPRALYAGWRPTVRVLKGKVSAIPMPIWYARTAGVRQPPASLAYETLGALPRGHFDRRIHCAGKRLAARHAAPTPTGEGSQRVRPFPIAPPKERGAVNWRPACVPPRGHRTTAAAGRRWGGKTARRRRRMAGSRG